MEELVAIWVDFEINSDDGETNASPQKRKIATDCGLGIVLTLVMVKTLANMLLVSLCPGHKPWIVSLENACCD